jgi:hypothetical protein
MVDIGITQLDNIESIVDFLKVDKMYSLIFDEDPLNKEEPTNEDKTLKNAENNTTSVSQIAS